MKNLFGVKNIYITESDMYRLEDLLSVAIRLSIRDFHQLEDLTKELMKAEIVKPTEVPDSVITMNSKVLLMDLERNEQKSYVLVFPREANIELNKVSVLSPTLCANISETLTPQSIRVEGGEVLDHGSTYC